MGIHKGDEIISIDGRPYSGLGDWAHPMVDTPAGRSITVTMRSAGSAAMHTVVLPVRAKQTDYWEILAESTLYFLLPGVCILLGFWVAFQRPRDPMAWLLLALMLTFPHLRKLQGGGLAARLARARRLLPHHAGIHVAGHDVPLRPVFSRVLPCR